MSVFPFVWFLILFIYIYYKRGFDVSAYITLLYVITSIGAVVMNVSGIAKDAFYTDPSLLTTLVYCICLTIVILPVYRFNSNKVHIKIYNKRIFDPLVYFFFIGVLFVIIVHWKDILFIAAFPDLSELRYDVVHENITFAANLGRFKFIDQIFTYSATISMVCIPIFFISFIYLKRSKIYCAIALIGSLLRIAYGYLQIDRSTTFYWLLLFLLCFVIFKPLMNKMTKTTFYKIGGAIVVFLLFNFILITYGRFKDSSTGVVSELIRYIGQPFYNFGNLFENLDNKEGFNTRYLFPTIHYFIIGDYEGNVALQQLISDRTGLDCGVFYTVLGSFVVDANQIGPFVFLIIYTLFSRICINNNMSNISLSRFFSVFFFLNIPAFGIIAYCYTNIFTIPLILIVVLYFKLFNKRLIYK